MDLLDTNVASELRKPRPHGAVLAGIEITRAQDAAKAAEIEAWRSIRSPPAWPCWRWTARASASGRG